MSDLAIRVENLGKRYRLRHEAGRVPYRTLREDLLQLPRRVWRQWRSARRTTTEEFWALQGVSFEVKAGEVLGVIGRNGAGKSTLLKILSRIVDPATGSADIFGRVGSLLEVGTGFHPELTGRENIFLSGALLGMRRPEVRKRFDEIVAFAGVEQFLDTPCKHYSSGMYTRLGFAVAAHLDTDILLVDEVLSVGDAEFQRRCLEKMNTVARQGRTVLLVSHNLSAVSRLCTQALVLTRGRGQWWGPDVRGAINDYLLAGSAAESEWLAPEKFGGAAAKSFVLERLRLIDRNGDRLVGAVAADEMVFIEITGVVRAAHPALCVGIALYAEDESALFWSYQTDMDESRRPALSPGRQTLRAALPAGLLNEGRYRIDFLAGLHSIEWIAAPQTAGPCVWLDVRGVGGNSPFRLLRRPVLLAPVLEWSVRAAAERAPADHDRVSSTPASSP